MIKLLNLVIKKLDNYIYKSKSNDLIEILKLIKEIKFIYNKNRF